MARHKTPGLLPSRGGVVASRTTHRRAGGGEGRQQRERDAFEDFSLNSSSTDSTRPTVHTKRSCPSSATSRSIEESLCSATGSSPHNNGAGSVSSLGNSHHPSVGGGSVSVSVASSHQTQHHNNKASQRKRVPGGAAAKLMFRGPLKSAESSDGSSFSNQYDSQDDGPVDTSEIFDMINRTRAEFETGPPKIGRLSPVTICGDEEIEVSVACDPLVMTPSQEEKADNLPHILNRQEAYYENASAAVAAILTPTRGGENGSLASGTADMTFLQSVCGSRISASGTTQTGASSSVSAFQSPRYADNCSVASQGSGEIDHQFEHLSQGSSFRKSPTTEPLISCATEEKLDRMSQKMLDPSKTLSDLLRAIASPPDATSLDRAFMVRRKNACGALKVLTAHSRRRKQICWTVGVLPALTSVLQDAGEDCLEDTYPDDRTRTEYEEARRRAIAALTNLAMPVPNRLAVFHTPGLVQALICVVLREYGECLEGACAILAYLAKSNENKILMAQVPGLFEAVLRVLRPGSSIEQEEVLDFSRRQDYPWASSGSGSDSSVSTAAAEEASVLSGSTDTSSEGQSSDEDDDDLDADYTDDDEMSSDHESITGSEGSCESSMSESSGDSGSDYCPAAAVAGSDKSRSSKGTQRRKANHSFTKAPTLATPNSASCCKPKLQSHYDRDKNMSAARKNLFAMLGHLAKEKDNAYRLARVSDLVPVVVDISKMHDSPIHVLAVQLLAHLTRHRLNSKSLVFKMQVVIPAMVKATYSNSEVARRYACFALQNFSHDKSCRQELASSEKLITALCKRARHSKDPEERLAAICALKNLTDEPANLIPLSNTAECIATLMQIAHGQEEGVTEMMQFRACDALATISHWLRKIATNGQSTDAIKHGYVKPVGMFVPSLKVIGWEQYE